MRDLPARGWRAARGCRWSPPLPYPPEPALAALRDTEHLVLVGARAPVAFFAYPGLPGTFAPEGCEITVLAEPDEDAAAALIELADLVGRRRPTPARTGPSRPELPSGPLTPATLAAVRRGAAARGRDRRGRGADLRRPAAGRRPPALPGTTG